MVVIVWQSDSQPPMQSVPITNNVMRSNSTHGEVYPKQHHVIEVYLKQNYVIKFVSDLRQICGFLRFPPPIKTSKEVIEMFKL